MFKLRKMKDWTTQQQPNRSMKLFGEISYQTICGKLYNFLKGLTVGDSGQWEYIDGNYCFVIDYRIKEYECELYCAQLFYEGDEVFPHWIDWDFSDAKPDISSVEETPRITDYYIYV